MSAAEHDRAVVLGGSMAGLLAARVLAERYGHVVLVDRDDLTRVGAKRRGVPQGAHTHALLARGLQALEGLFPGLTDELISDGATAGDPLGEARLHFSGHRLRRGCLGLRMLSMSRPFLERHVRTRVLALPNVAVSPASDIIGLAGSPDGSRVTGAKVYRRAESSVAEVLDAGVVVDATGRGSRTPRWLEDLGFDAPAEERVEIGVGYATCMYRLPQDALDGDWGSLQGPSAANPRGGALSCLENGRWMLTLMGVLGDHPPTDVAGFVEFAGTLTFPDIHGAIRDAEPVSGPVAHRFPANVRRRYERLDRLPDGMIVLGDAVCSFNPVYGQGMTVAALEALALRRHLQRHGDPQLRRLFRELSRVIDVPWQMAIGADLALPGVPGECPRKLRLLSAYIRRLHAAAAGDAALGAAFLRVSGLVDSPTALLRPGVVRRVLVRSAVDDSATPTTNEEEGHDTHQPGAAGQVLRSGRKR